MRKIALWEAKHPKTVIIAALLLLIPAFLGFIGTKVNYDILSYLPDELESVQGEQVLDKTFNTAGISIVITENMQPKQTLALKNEILAVDGVSSSGSIRSPISASRPISCQMCSKIYSTVPTAARR